MPQQPLSNSLHQRQPQPQGQPQTRPEPNQAGHSQQSQPQPGPTSIPAAAGQSSSSFGGSAPPTTAASTAMSATKTRQYAHLQSQLAQLNAHLADTENLVRMTAVQAEDMRFLGGYMGALFMGAASVLGEHGARKDAGAAGAAGGGGDGGGDDDDGDNDDDDDGNGLHRAGAGYQSGGRESRR